MNLYNIHHFATFNIGDLSCAVAQYFPLNCEIKNIWSFEPEPGSTAIFGGGGLFHDAFKDQIKKFVETPKTRAILWGIGTNTHGVDHDPYPEWADKCIAGFRDYPTKYRWVPCPSSMSPLFDEHREITREAVVYRHAWDSVIPTIEEPTENNNAAEEGKPAKGMKEVLDFLGSAEYVITDTYHGAYWATLLGRKVIVYPFSTRHRMLRYKVPLLGTSENWRTAMPFAKSYPEALGECREANISFYKDVLNLL
jgi:hypothetical protein